MIIRQTLFHAISSLTELSFSCSNYLELTRTELWLLVGQVVLAIYSIGCQLDGSGATVELARYNIFNNLDLEWGGGR